ncbi:DivIVA domain-containing protein [Streptosporangium sp. NPDC050855]|uniref:DivIVA domain-containing protein n=1 Tax=Streptosporangium sp. NPDC050855 TaxID=3366194 RepID=UPI003787DCC3
MDLLIRRIEGTLGRGSLEGEPITADEIRDARFRTKLGGYHEIAVDFALEAFIVAIETRQTAKAGQAGQTARVEQTAQVEQDARVEQTARTGQGVRTAQVAQSAQPAQSGRVAEAARAAHTAQATEAAQAAQAAQAETVQIAWDGPPGGQEPSVPRQAAPGVTEWPEPGTSGAQPGSALPDPAHGDRDAAHGDPDPAYGEQGPEPGAYPRDAGPPGVLGPGDAEEHAARIERVAFRPGRLGMGYREEEVDAFLDRVVATLRGTTERPLSADDVREARFATVMLRPGYAVAEVDEFLADLAGVMEARLGR